MSNDEVPATIVISSTEERNRLFAMIKQISGSMTRIESEKEYIKESTKKIVDEFQLPAKLVSTMIATYHKDNFIEVVARSEQFKNLYMQVTGVQA